MRPAFVRRGFRAAPLTYIGCCAARPVSLIQPAQAPVFNAEFTSIREAGCSVTRAGLSMTMRCDHRAIGGTAKRPVPHAALLLTGLLLLIRP